MHFLLALAIFANSGVSGGVELDGVTRLAVKRCVIRVTDQVTLETVATGVINPGLHFNLRWENPVFAHGYHIDYYGCTNAILTFSPRDFSIFDGQIREITVMASGV